MNRLRHALRPVVLAFLALGGCRTTAPVGTSVTVEGPPQQHAWEGLVGDADRALLQGLDSRWVAALTAVRSAGVGRRVAAEGALLNPAAALPRPELSPGPYRCRIVSFGPAARGGRAVTTQNSLFCHVGVADNRIWLARQTGAGGRPGGYIHADTDLHAIFIGAAALGMETVPPAYTEGSPRNLVGRVERIGPFRYRLVMPEAGARISITELRPVTAPYGW